MWTISYLLSTLFRQLVILMRYDSFCFVNKKKQKTSSVISYQLQRRFAETQRAIFQVAVWKRTCQSIFGLQYAEKHGWVIEKNMVSVNWMD